MQQGQKLNDSDGVQVSVFPSQDLYITQGTNTSYSHYGTKNTDNASGATKRRLYAPCDVKCVSNQTSGGYGVVIYQTVNPVHTPRYDLTHFSLVLMHDNNSIMWEVGKTYEQGEWFYTEGDVDASGLTTGIHVHYEVAIGLTTSRIQSVTDGYFHINPNQVYLDDIFYKNLTNVVRENAPVGVYYGDHTFNFLEFSGGVIPPDPTERKGLPIWLLGQKI